MIVTYLFSDKRHINYWGGGPKSRVSVLLVFRAYQRTLPYPGPNTWHIVRGMLAVAWVFVDCLHATVVEIDRNGISLHIMYPKTLFELLRSLNRTPNSY